MPSSATASRREILILSAAMAILSAGLVVYAVTVAGYGDEGFHLLAAQLILRGKRPYADFFYQHPPLYAYLTAGWMRAFGESWRSSHVMSALLAASSAILAGGFVFSRLAETRWGLAGGIIAATLTAAQLPVVEFGTIGQPYGLCLFLTVAAFRLAVAGEGRPGGALPFWSGVCAGTAAASWLLTAPLAPVLLLWMVRQEPAGRRSKKCLPFVLGAALPFLPFFWLAWQAPRAALFDVVQYHLFYRHRNFSDVAWRDLGITFQLLDSPALLVTALLAAVGLLVVVGRREWEARLRQELYLCAWLMAGLGALAALARPTFSQYFVSVIPFAGILAAMGVYAIGARIWAPGQAVWPLAVVLGLSVTGLALPLYHASQGGPVSWKEMEKVARQIDEVTPPGGSLYADDLVYFYTRRPPLPGLENHVSMGLELPPALLAYLHIVPESQIDDWLREGRFDTVCIEATEEDIEALGLRRAYKKHAVVYDYDVFWERAGPAPRKKLP